MKIDVRTENHEDRTAVELTINGKSLALTMDMDLSDPNLDQGVAAFFAGYAIGVADTRASIQHVLQHHHDHEEQQNG